MSRRSKHHTEEFKVEAVELVERSGKSVSVYLYLFMD
jgi:transposase-like protein